MKKVLSLTLASAMLLGTGTTALAADLDLINQVNSARNSSFNQVVRDTDSLRYVSDHIGDYLIEYNKKMYKVTEVNQAMKNGAANFEAAIEGLTPVKDADEEVGELKVLEVSAINKTTLEVTLSEKVDAVSSSNFTIEGASVSSATLGEDMKTVTIKVSGLDYEGTYTIVTNDIKINGESKDFGSLKFTMPAVTDYWTLEVTPSSETVVANGADNTVITFKLLDVEGNVDENADDMVLAIDSTFGNLANNRVTIQNGVGKILLSSEYSTQGVDARITAQIIEASDAYKDLIGKVVGQKIVKFVPSGAETDVNAITFLDAESNQADRVVLYFDKEVTPVTFVQTTKTGKYITATHSGSGATLIEKQVMKDEVDITVSQDGDSKEILGFRSVEGNKKAIEVILAKKKADASTLNQLKDNREVTVKAKLGTTDNSKKFILTDARQPEVTSVAPEGQKTLKLKFSESIAKGTFKIDGIWSEETEFDVVFGEYDAATGIDYRDTAELTLKTYEVGTEGYTSENKDKQRYFEDGSHGLTVTNLYDFAGLSDSANISTTQGLTFNIKADKAAPTALVVVESPEQFRVRFDKEIDYNPTTLVPKDLFKDNFEIYDEVQKKYIPVADVTGAGATDIFSSKPKFTVDRHDNELVVELTKDWTALLKGSQDAYYNYKFRFNIPAASFTNATNGVESAVITLDLNQPGSPLNSADNKSPEISKIEQTENDQIFKVTMSEPVKLTNDGTTGIGGERLTYPAGNTPKVQVEFQGKDKKGKNVVIAGEVKNYSAKQKGADMAFDVSTTGTGVDTLQSLVNTGYSENWKVVVKSISDDVGNTAATLTKDFVIESETNATAFTMDLIEAFDTDTQGKQDKIEITFSKAVVNTGGINDLTSTSNWTLNGSALTNVASIDVAKTASAVEGYDKVIITFNDYRALKADSNVISVNKSIFSKDGTPLTGGNEKVATTINVDALLAALEAAKPALQTAINTATATKVGVEISADGKAVTTGTNWVMQEVNDALDLAIATATTALNDSTTAAQITSAVSALNTAIGTYNSAKADGLFDISLLQDQIDAANAAKVDVVISTDGTDVAQGTDWVTQVVNDALDGAITTATSALTTVTDSDQVTSAVSALNGAIGTYNSAKANGSMQ